MNQPPAEVLAELKAIFERFMLEDFYGKGWQYCNFAKSFIGNAMLEAIRRYEPGYEIPARLIR
jgi:hypothetical protein